MKFKKARYKQGRFKPRYPKKYKGNSNNIIYRSGLELKFFEYCDKNKNIISWASEEVVVPYFCPTDRRNHRYFPDLLINVKNKDGEIDTYLIEIKPKNQTKLGKSKNPKTQMRNTLTFAKNKAKWDAAEKFCERKNWKFKILTEQDIK